MLQTTGSSNIPLLKDDDQCDKATQNSCKSTPGIIELNDCQFSAGWVKSTLATAR